MKDGLSPEERLLRLIRGQKKTEKPAQPAQPSPQHNFTREVSKAKAPESYSLATKYLNLENIKKTLSVIFILSCAYLLTALIYPFFIPKISPLVKEAGKAAPPEKITLTANAKPYEFYSRAVKNRQLFGVSGPQNENEGAQVILGDESIKDINLVGIVSGDNPQAVIEDKKAQKTYYVAKNQAIGQFQVEDIQEGKIILNSNGQKFELSL